MLLAFLQHARRTVSRALIPLQVVMDCGRNSSFLGCFYPIELFGRNVKTERLLCVHFPASLEWAAALMLGGDVTCVILHGLEVDNGAGAGTSFSPVTPPSRAR